MACLSPSSGKEKAPSPPPNLDIFHSAKIYMKFVFENNVFLACQKLCGKYCCFSLMLNNFCNLLNLEPGIKLLSRFFMQIKYSSTSQRKIFLHTLLRGSLRNGADSIRPRESAWSLIVSNRSWSFMHNGETHLLRDLLKEKIIQTIAKQLLSLARFYFYKDIVMLKLIIVKVSPPEQNIRKGQCNNSIISNILFTSFLIDEVSWIENNVEFIRNANKKREK